VIRFTKFLQELSSETQIMMITHNTMTMEIADALYGVTMSEPGVSENSHRQDRVKMRPDFSIAARFTTA